MKKNMEKHVYCTGCVNGKDLLGHIMGYPLNMPEPCQGCYPFNPEDSFPIQMRKNYELLEDQVVYQLTGADVKNVLETLIEDGEVAPDTNLHELVMNMRGRLEFEWYSHIESYILSEVQDQSKCDHCEEWFEERLEETKIGLLCSKCKRAIKSRGEEI